MMKAISYQHILKSIQNFKSKIWICGIVLSGIFLSPDKVGAQPNYNSANLLNQLTRPSETISKRSSSTDRNFDGNGDSREINPGETLVLADLEGPGIIRHIWNTSASLNPFSASALVLRIYWDGAQKPSVEVPLGDFFGVGFGAKKDFQSFPVSVSSFGRAQNCYWEMPFRKNAKITLTNEAENFGPVYFYYYVDWDKVKSLPDDILYFHARYHQQERAEKGDHVILNTTGKGKYAGTVYSVFQVQNGWFGEGDDRFYIDGEDKPSLVGTGTEDYFGDAWGFREFAGPFHGVTNYEGPLTGDRVSAYRWHITDPVSFSKSLKLTIEHRGSNVDWQGKQSSGSDERPDRISSVAFWYQTPVVYTNTPLPAASKRIPPYQISLAATLKVSALPEKIKKGKEGVFFEPGTPDGQLNFEFQVKKSGRYKVSAILFDDLFGANYQPMVDGKMAGPELDLCSKGSDWNEYVLGLFDLSEGTHYLSFQGKGASSKHQTVLPNKFSMGISSLILLDLNDL